MAMRIFLFLLVVICIGGCTLWPSTTQEQSKTRVEDSISNDIEQKLINATVQIEIAKLRGAESCIPAQYEKTLGKYEYVEDLNKMGSLTSNLRELLVLESKVKEMRHNLNYLSKHTHCNKYFSFQVKKNRLDREMQLLRHLINVNSQFSINSKKLLPQFKTVLLKAIPLIKQYDDYLIKIVGHADDQGSEKYNLALGEMRARSVLEFLIANGLSDKKISIKSKGEHLPIEDNVTDYGRLANRRVEIALSFSTKDLVKKNETIMVKDWRHKNLFINQK